MHLKAIILQVSQVSNLFICFNNTSLPMLTTYTTSTTYFILAYLFNLLQFYLSRLATTNIYYDSADARH
jgi:hypothetical protein